MSINPPPDTEARTETASLQPACESSIRTALRSAGQGAWLGAKNTLLVFMPFSLGLGMLMSFAIWISIVKRDFSLQRLPDYQGLGMAIIMCLSFMGMMGLIALFCAFLVACMAGIAGFIPCIVRPQMAQVAASPGSVFATSLDPTPSRRWLPTFSMGSLLWFVIHVALLSGCFVLARDRAPPMAIMACFLAALVAQVVHLLRASNGVATRAIIITVATILVGWLCFSLWEVVRPSLFLPSPEGNRNDLSNLFHTFWGWGLISLILPLCGVIVSGVCWCAMRGKAWLALSSLCLLVAWLGVLGFAIGSR